MIPILVMGKSGSGKSCSLRNLPAEGTVVVNVLGKPLPFKSNLKVLNLNDYNKIVPSVVSGRFERCVIDDAGYLMTGQFMDALTARGRGGDVYSLYGQMADNLYRMIRAIQTADGNQRVYLMFHEQTTDLGDVKPRTFGKLIEEKVCLEGMVTIVLRAIISNGQYVFRTNSDGFDVAKSPMGMFPDKEIENDLNRVDQIICDYYGMGGNNHDET